MSRSLYDEDGIDGPFERLMAKPSRSFYSKRPDATDEHGLEHIAGGYRAPKSGRWCRVKLDRSGAVIEWQFGWDDKWRGSTDSRSKALRYTRSELDYCHGCLELCEPIAEHATYCPPCEALDAKAEAAE